LAPSNQGQKDSQACERVGWCPYHRQQSQSTDPRRNHSPLRRLGSGWYRLKKSEGPRSPRGEHHLAPTSIKKFRLPPPRAAHGSRSQRGQQRSIAAANSADQATCPLKAWRQPAVLPRGPSRSQLSRRCGRFVTQDISSNLLQIMSRVRGTDRAATVHAVAFATSTARVFPGSQKASYLSLSLSALQPATRGRAGKATGCTATHVIGDAIGRIFV